MKRTLLPIALLFICLLVARADAQPLPEKRDITVHITLDGKPFSGDTIDIVRARRDDVAAVWGGALTPDADGSFRIPNMEDGDYRLHVHPTLSKQDIYLPPEFTVNEKHTHFEIALERFPVLKVKVLRPDGTPVRGGHFTSNLHISAKERGRPRGGMQDNSSGQIDEATGVAEIQLRQLGIISHFSLLVDGEGFGSSDKPLEVVPHQPLEVTLKLRAGATIQVRVLETGQAVGPGAPIPADAVPVGGIRFNIQFTSEDRQQESLTTHHGTQLLSQDGSVPLQLAHIPAGSYTIRPMRLNKEVFLTDEQTVQVSDGQTASLVFYVKPLHLPSLHLQINDEAGKPLANTNVAINLLTADAGDNERRNIRRYLAHAGTTDATGKLNLYPVPMGTYTLSARMKTPTGGFQPITQDVPVQITAQETSIKLTAQRGG